MHDVQQLPSSALQLGEFIRVTTSNQNVYAESRLRKLLDVCSRVQGSFCNPKNDSQMIKSVGMLCRRDKSLRRVSADQTTGVWKDPDLVLKFDQLISRIDYRLQQNSFDPKTLCQVATAISRIGYRNASLIENLAAAVKIYQDEYDSTAKNTIHQAYEKLGMNELEAAKI